MPSGSGKASTLKKASNSHYWNLLFEDSTKLVYYFSHSNLVTFLLYSNEVYTYISIVWFIPTLKMSLYKIDNFF